MNTPFQNLDDIVLQLREHGAIMIPGFLSHEKCDTLAESIRSLVSSVDVSKTYECKEYLVNSTGPNRINTYPKLCSYRKPVLNIRSMHDKDFIDIFNADKLFDLSWLRNSTTIADVIGCINSSLKVKNINVYVSSASTPKRGYHYDTAPGIAQFKALVYLTDVTDESFGPYSYILGSHKAMNIKPNENNTQVFCGKRGTVILSNQNGLHCGIGSQKDGKERIVAVANIMV